MSTAPPAAEPSDRFVYDPATPVPSRGGPVCCTGTPDAPEGSFDQSEVELRSDVLVYTTAALERGVEVTGPLQLVLYVSSDQLDTDFTGKLVDVYPDGKAYNVQEGILRGRYRDGFGKKVWMKPGEVYQVPIESLRLLEAQHVAYRRATDAEVKAAHDQVRNPAPAVL